MPLIPNRLATANRPEIGRPPPPPPPNPTGDDERRSSTFGLSYPLFQRIPS
jgi:hypothetical protein